MSELKTALAEEDYLFVEMIDALIKSICKDGTTGKDGNTVEDHVRELYATFFQAVIPFFDLLFLAFLTFFFWLF